MIERTNVRPAEVPIVFVSATFVSTVPALIVTEVIGDAIAALAVVRDVAHVDVEIVSPEARRSVQSNA